ncbi:deaminase [Nocardioides sp. Root1257]|uniref:dihydrofolate reductase family protein n=1 Tax=unclassified Nocardioides TaxID=2615069 RepID=UPI0006F943EA|nr:MULTISPECIES: dihydrofolate reductase family protein [unclassified Nocardioides]KQW53605.1 deaminase [Nocardioides sp. Root1257]KRC56291.1 deaminase [Nocardioides sp. Root224]
MGTIVINTNLTLDGVVEDPTGEEGLDRGGWFDSTMGADRAAWAEVEAAEAEATAAILMGRRSYDWFARRWQERPGPWADRLRAAPKYVVTSSDHDLVWDNTTVLDGDPVEAVKRLRDEVDGEVVVYASRQLVQVLLEHDLVDQIRLIVLPTVLGAGLRLFGETTSPVPVRLVDCRVIGDGLAFLTYDVSRQPS